MPHERRPPGASFAAREPGGESAAAPDAAELADEGAATPVLRATFWGTRGSIPSPGPDTVRFGGNTPCLEVRAADGRRFIFDAGTGIRALGRRLQAESGPARIQVFLTHFHWDHIQGIPFFAPLFDADASIGIHAPPQEGVEVRTLFARQLGPNHFPVPDDALAAELRFTDVDAAPFHDGDVEIAALRVRHPTHTVGYRVRAGGAALVYIPDDELAGTGYPVPEDWYHALVEFVGDADVLIHDAMYTAEEYAQREGWGHSTFEDAMRLAERAGVRRLYFFHHAPDRLDRELAAILAARRADVAGRASAVELHAAAEGDEVAVAAGAVRG